MGDAFTAVADSKETIAYNPAGLRFNDVDWSLSFPFLWLAYDETVKDAMNQSIEFDLEDEQALEDLKGKRAYFEVQLGFPFLFIPNYGLFIGFSGDAWIDFSFPAQSVIPLVHMELIVQSVVEFGMAFELFESGLSVGSNLKVVDRKGVIADVNPLRIASMLDDPDRLIETYNPDPPPKKLVVDLGVLYRFDHPLKPRIGISALNVAAVSLDGEYDYDTGGVGYGSAGSVTQLNTIGFAITKSLKTVDLIVSSDFQDFTFSYFPHASFQRRVAIGFEAAYGRLEDNSHLVSFQLGVRELAYPSFGFRTRIGVVDFSFAQWIANIGTEKNKELDKHYMFLLSLVF